jgi:hypothetical protein
MRREEDLAKQYEGKWRGESGAPSPAGFEQGKQAASK